MTLGGRKETFRATFDRTSALSLKLAAGIIYTRMGHAKIPYVLLSHGIMIEISKMYNNIES